MPDPASRTDDRFVAPDGVAIHVSTWQAADPRAVVQLVHGVGEHGLRYEPFARDLVARGYTVVAADLRGHGRTGLAQRDGDPTRLGPPGPGGLRAMMADIRQHSAILRAEQPGARLVLLGHSLGSLLAQKVLDRHAADYDAAVLSGTAYRTVLHMNSGDLNKRHAHLGTTGAEWLSRDPAVVDAFVADPLTFDAKVLKLYGIADSIRLLGRPRRLGRDLPLLIQIGSDDPLGGPRSVELLARAYRRRGGLTDVTVNVYPGARHEVYNETNRDEVIADLADWLDARVRTSALG